MDGKFLDLDNMQIIWDKVDRNFLRKDDIPSLEFGKLITENKNIIEAINELNRYARIFDKETTIECQPIGFENASKNGEINFINVIYNNYININKPAINPPETDWLTIEQMSKNIYKLSIDPNTGYARNADITFSCTRGKDIISKIIPVSQSAGNEAEINVNNIPINIEYNGISEIYEVSFLNANMSTVQAKSYSDWISISESSRTDNIISYNIIISENNNETTQSRKGILKFSCIGTNGYEKTVSVEISQKSINSASIILDKYLINSAYSSRTFNVIVTYTNYNNILPPIIDDNIIKSISEISNNGNEYKYSIVLKYNSINTVRTGNVIFQCLDFAGETISSELKFIQYDSPKITCKTTGLTITQPFDPEKVFYGNDMNILINSEVIIEVTYENCGEISAAKSPNRSKFEYLDHKDNVYRYKLLVKEQDIDNVPSIDFRCYDITGQTLYSMDYRYKPIRETDYAFQVNPGGSLYIDYDQNEFTFEITYHNYTPGYNFTYFFGSRSFLYNSKISVIGHEGNTYRYKITDIPNNYTSEDRFEVLMISNLPNLKNQIRITQLNSSSKLSGNKYQNILFERNNYNISYAKADYNIKVYYNNYQEIFEPAVLSDWMSINSIVKHGNEYIYNISIDKNSTYKFRNGNISFKCINDNGTIVSELFTIYQVPEPEIDMISESIVLEPNTSTIIEVTYNKCEEILKVAHNIQYCTTVDELEHTDNVYKYKINLKQPDEVDEGSSVLIYFKCKDYSGKEYKKYLRLYFSSPKQVHWWVTPNPIKLDYNQTEVEFTIKAFHGNVSTPRIVSGDKWLGNVRLIKQEGDLYFYKMNNISINYSKNIREGMLYFGGSTEGLDDYISSNITIIQKTSNQEII